MSKIREEFHEFLWVIPNHRTVVMNPFSMLAASKVCNITTQSGKVWKIQMGYVKHGAPVIFSAFIQILKCPAANDDLEVQVALLHPEAGCSSAWSTFQVNKLRGDQITKMEKVALNGYHYWNLGDDFGSLLDSDGSMQWKVQLTFTFSEDEEDGVSVVTNQDWKRNVIQLLDQSNSTDIRIVCSDGIIFNAHQLILSAQSPVFASLVSTDMREKRTGELQLPDIGSATMKILLDWIYTGELAEEWRDPTNVVEMVYAAEKYALTGIKKILDDQLGKQQDYGGMNLQLLDLAQKTNLKRAEARLLDRVKNSVTLVDNTTDLFALLDQFNVVRKPTY